MNLRPRRIAAVTALALALAGTTTASAQPRSGPYRNPTVPAATDQQLVNDMRFRAEAGLRADRPYVKKLFDDARAGLIQASTDVGGIVTPDEAAILDARTNAVDQVTAVIDDYFKAHREIYAGAWIDQAKGLVGVGVTANKTQVEQELAARIGQTTAIWHVELMHYSLDQLYAVQHAVDQAASELRANSVDVTSTSIDEEANTVYVAAASDTTRARNVIESRFSGSPIKVEYEDRPVLDGIDGPNAPPFRGGQLVNRPLPENPRYEAQCTSAFVAYHVERSEVPAVFDYTYYLLTAGHCETNELDEGVSGAVWFQRNQVIGQSQFNEYHSGTNADALSIAIAQPAYKSNEVAVESGDYRRIHCMMTTDVKKGQLEIISGARTGGYRTGKLLRTHASVTYTDPDTKRQTTLVEQNMTDYYSAPGDSGGSVFGTRVCKYRADGIHSGGTRPGSVTTRKYYTPMYAATKALGLSGVETTDG
ncbi:MAG TPA: trypsin-like serine protease [Mycobacteriales bacterium]|nr:trypsin-like serine protease [Mycobacteriales bacterium]